MSKLGDLRSESDPGIIKEAIDAIQSMPHTMVIDTIESAFAHLLQVRKEYHRASAAIREFTKDSFDIINKKGPGVMEGKTDANAYMLSHWRAMLMPFAYEGSGYDDMNPSREDDGSLTETSKIVRSPAIGPAPLLRSSPCVELVPGLSTYFVAEGAACVRFDGNKMVVELGPGFQSSLPEGTVVELGPSVFRVDSSMTVEMGKPPDF